VNPFALSFMQHALVASVAVCAVAPLVGTFLVQRQQSLTGDGLGHVAFAGVGIAFLVGVNPLVGALALTLLAAVVLQRLQRGGLSGDLSLALVFYGGIAFGFLVATKSGGGVNRVLGVLFGSPLSLSTTEAAAVVALAGAVLAVIVTLYRPLVALAFDEHAARVSGLPVDGLVLALTLVVALVVVGGMSTLGLLLIAAMMVVPVAAAARVTRSYRTTMVVAAAVGAGSAVVGLLAAFYADLTPGAAIVLTTLAAYAVAVAAGRRAGAAA
jgi:zinc transport system permease protein